MQYFLQFSGDAVPSSTSAVWQEFCERSSLRPLSRCVAGILKVLFAQHNQVCARASWAAPSSASCSPPSNPPLSPSRVASARMARSSLNKSPSRLPATLHSMLPWRTTTAQNTIAALRRRCCAQPQASEAEGASRTTRSLARRSLAAICDLSISNAASLTRM